MTGGSRIARRFAALKAEGRAGLVTFVTAGDPDRETSKAIFHALPEAGADVIELGVPFSDPMADGPSVQESSLRALRNGHTVKATLDMVREFRGTDDDTPVVLMGYYNPIYSHGTEAFTRDAAAAGVDGLIVVDLPPEEAEELASPARAAGLDLIFLAAPTTDDERLSQVARDVSGFLYYVSITGITGTRSAAVDDVAQAVARIRRHVSIPIAVGFGIRTPEQAAEIARIADAAVVGSALTDAVGDNLDDAGQPKPGCADAVTALVKALAERMRGARGGAAA